MTEITYGPGGTTYAGRDAVNLFRAKTLVSSLKMYAAIKILPTRGVSATRLLELATEYTGKKYKRGQHTQAAEDVRAWCAVMASAIPTTVNGEQV